MEKTRVLKHESLRQFLGINKYSHMSDILKCIKTFTMNQLSIYTKLSFLNSIKNNVLTFDIFNRLCSDLKNHGKNSHSFAKDILLLEKTFNLDIIMIFASTSRLKLVLNKRSDLMKERV